MKKRHFDVETDGFYGAYWKCKSDSDCAMIAMIGDDSEDYLARTSVKWLHKLGVNVMTMSPAKKDYGHHNYPLERIEKAISWYIQVLWIFSMLLLLVRKFERDRIWKKGEPPPVWLLMALTVCVYGFSQVLNTPVVTVYRFGIYGFCFFTGYFIFSHDEVVERLSKWWRIFLIVAGATGIFYTIYYFGENYAVEPVLNNLPACIYCWFSILAILAFMKKNGNSENKVSRWMSKKSWGIYVFHYLPLACVAYYLRCFVSELPAGIVYIVVGISAFAGALFLYEIISRIPIIRWCVLGVKKEKKHV